MTEWPNFGSLKQFSAPLSGIVAATAPSIMSVQSRRALDSRFVWMTGLIVTADATLSEEGEVAVTLARGKRVAATVAGRDATTDVAIHRTKTGDAPPFAFNGTQPEEGTFAVSVGSQEEFQWLCLT